MTNDPAKTVGKRRGRPALSVERIVSTAVELVDAEGVEALSMRALADKLESGTATLYRHFGNKVDLLAAIIEALLGEIDLGEDAFESQPWEEGLRAMASRMSTALRRHPGAARLLADVVPTGPTAMRLRERSLAMLLRNGFPPDLAAKAHATVARYVLGAVVLAAGPGLGADQQTQAVHLEAIDAARFPATVQVAPALPISEADEFAFGLDLMIAGLRARL